MTNRSESSISLKAHSEIFKQLAKKRCPHLSSILQKLQWHCCYCNGIAAIALVLFASSHSPKICKWGELRVQIVVLLGESTINLKLVYLVTMNSEQTCDRLQKTLVTLRECKRSGNRKWTNAMKIIICHLAAVWPNFLGMCFYFPQNKCQ